ncbi:hypothetical protein CLV62_1204 [Dysgonomonas alginatilytica]|uniref:Uncharacterized protein n=1 Tax=Dysgonomonas alginatilytica TaxID=1605892 RepID=A0A2V3PL53_9BACT|nr:hypothetical protein CLV62_1204 [Dysgonomonas alginatilytica]
MITKVVYRQSTDIKEVKVYFLGIRIYRKIFKDYQGNNRYK